MQSHWSRTLGPTSYWLREGDPWQLLSAMALVIQHLHPGVTSTTHAVLHPFTWVTTGPKPVDPPIPNEERPAEAWKANVRPYPWVVD